MQITILISQVLKDYCLAHRVSLNPQQRAQASHLIWGTIASSPVNVAQAASIVGCCAQTIRRLIAKNAITAINISEGKNRPNYRIPLSTCFELRDQWRMQS